MRILTAEEMREIDRAATSELGLPSLVLMENAALGVADAVGRHFPRAAAAAIFCGPGNNGGDGLALARQLATRGYRVELFLASGGRALRGDAAVQENACRQLGLEPRALDRDGLGAALRAARACDLVVDALFGTGLERPLSGFFAELVEGLSGLPLPRLAVDLPSGLDASRAEPPGPHLRADVTVTFAAPKVAHVFPPASAAAGELVVTDLGFPLDRWVAAPGGLHLLVSEELASFLLPRARASHKGDCGHALIVAGAPGRAGAAILAARGAVRGGAGLVTVAVPAPLLAAVDVGSLESMTLALAATAAGSIGRAAAEAALAAAAGKDALAVGPGLGQEPEAQEAIRLLVGRCGLPLVLDADGLNAFAGRARDLAARAAATVLTPHPGELGRLLGVPTDAVQRDRVAAARRAARESQAFVVLKGQLSLVAAPDGETHVNPTGNPGMATGGTGDVLTGLLAALLAQGYEPFLAAQLAVHLHGLAGDLVAARRGEVGLCAGDLAEALPEARERLAAGSPEPGQPAQ
jgi:NAD(P)H-hydrate epimerase